jgi:hypothetical protein
MTFFFIALGVMYVGRKLGWALSKSVLYTAPLAASIVLCVVWGVAVAAAIRGLIDWQQPGAVLRWIMGYALGGYVAIPNFGLLNEAIVTRYSLAADVVKSDLDSEPLY